MSTFWDNLELPHHPPLAADERVDVAVVGAGITGLTAARLLVREGRSGFTLLHAELEALRSYVLAVRLRGQEPPDGLFFDTAEPYNYTRLQPVNGGKLLIVGGKDQPTGHAQPEESFRRLEEYTRTSRFKPLAGGPQVAKLNLHVVRHFIKDRLDLPRIDDLSQVRPGEGKVVRIGDERAALYREPSGELHAVSPVCTHADCIVHWNPGEKSWDCPCHGSRFSPEGRVIEGPAVRGLEPVRVESPAGRR